MTKWEVFEGWMGMQMILFYFLKILAFFSSKQSCAVFIFIQIAHMKFTKVLEDTNCTNETFNQYQQVFFTKILLSSIALLNWKWVNNVCYYVKGAWTFKW